MMRKTSTRQLDSYVTIERPATGFDEINQPVVGWQELTKVWANILAQSGAESIRADKSTSTSKASIRIRPRSDLTASMRVVHGSTVYTILAVQPVAARQDHMDLVCEVVR